MTQADISSPAITTRPLPIGIFGGTFDPIHCGHLRIALDVAEALSAERIHLIPLRVAVHREQPVASPEQRFAMVRAAVADVPQLSADDRELHRSGASYTVDTLRSFRDEFGQDRPLCLLLGSDAFNGFMQWRAPRSILELAHLVVMQRPGYRLPDDPDLRSLVAGHRAQSLAELGQHSAGQILFHDVTQLDISSSDIRKRAARGRSIRYLTPDSVVQLIEKQELYTYPDADLSKS
jgi:nicotinate-nucleotide adenylyltransferase